MDISSRVRAVERRCTLIRIERTAIRTAVAAWEQERLARKERRTVETWLAMDEKRDATADERTEEESATADTRANRATASTREAKVETLGEKDILGVSVSPMTLRSLRVIERDRRERREWRCNRLARESESDKRASR